LPGRQKQLHLKHAIQIAPFSDKMIVEEAIQRNNGGNAWRLVDAGDATGKSINVHVAAAIGTARWRAVSNGYSGSVLGEHV
jgi:hypothetical protein